MINVDVGCGPEFLLQEFVGKTVFDRRNRGLA
jgi:hypothetical protein